MDRLAAINFLGLIIASAMLISNTWWNIVAPRQAVPIWNSFGTRDSTHYFVSIFAAPLVHLICTPALMR